MRTLFLKASLATSRKNSPGSIKYIISIHVLKVHITTTNTIPLHEKSVLSLLFMWKLNSIYKLYISIYIYMNHHYYYKLNILNTTNCIITMNIKQLLVHYNHFIQRLNIWSLVNYIITTCTKQYCQLWKLYNNHKIDSTFNSFFIVGRKTILVLFC